MNLDRKCSRRNRFPRHLLFAITNSARIQFLGTQGARNFEGEYTWVGV